MRSRWKSILYVTRASRPSVIGGFFMSDDRRRAYRLYTGRKFIKFKVKPSMLGWESSSFIYSRIHRKRRLSSRLKTGAPTKDKPGVKRGSSKTSQKR